MADILAFRRLITPTVVQIVFLIGLVAIVISSMSIMAAGEAQFTISLGDNHLDLTHEGGGLERFGMGLLTLFIGVLVWRILCELLLVVFRILEVLIELRDAHAKSV